MDELQTLRHELAELRREVNSLRRTRWITPGSIALILVAIVALGIGAPRRQDPTQPEHRPTQLAQEVVCKSLKVVDEAGHTMLQLASDKDGGMIVVNGADAKKRFFTAVENNAGFTDWFDATGARRASVFIGEKGNAEFHLTDQAERVSAVLQQADSGGFFALHGPDTNNRVAAGVDNGGGYFDISDSQGNLRESLYLSDKNTAQLKIIGADKITRFLLSGNADGGQAVSYGSDGKAKGLFPGP